ncbi:hypothetical protein JCM10212_006279 [Sporobolomyces blumeae]
MSTSARSAPSQGSTSCQLHFKERSCGARPLYRPAALRRNNSRSSTQRLRASPPQSPSLAAAETKSTWLGSLSTPWSPVAPDVSKELTLADVKGRMLPKSEWKPDDAAQLCADSDCSLRFDLLNRRHHCRACGDVFCSTHSSRSTFLWPACEDEPVTTAFTPRGTPRGTPRSSSLDLPSLAYSVSPSSSCISTGSSSTATSSSAPTCSPEPTRQPSLPAPVAARVCDRCYFSAPAPLLTPPMSGPPGSLAFNYAFAHASTNPLTLRHPRSRTSSASRTSSPAHSPPGQSSLGRSSSARVRSRTGSAASLSTSSEGAAYTSPATSVEILPTIPSNKVPVPSHARRELSPATTMRKDKMSMLNQHRHPEHLAVSEEEEPASHFGAYDARRGYGRDEDDDADSDSEDEAKHEARIRERRRHNQEFGSVQGGAWQSWATF